MSSPPSVRNTPGFCASLTDGNRPLCQDRPGTNKKGKLKKASLLQKWLKCCTASSLSTQTRLSSRRTARPRQRSRQRARNAVKNALSLFVLEISVQKTTFVAKTGSGQPSGGLIQTVVSGVAGCTFSKLSEDELGARTFSGGSN